VNKFKIAQEKIRDFANKVKVIAEGLMSEKVDLTSAIQI